MGHSGVRPMTGAVRVRTLTDADISSAAALHREVLDMEFLSRYGVAFMRTYYRAWCHAPGAIALAALDQDNDLVGAVLGAVDPGAHTRVMVRRYGIRLAGLLIMRALVDPALAKDLLVTRARRYLRGLARLAYPTSRQPSSSAGYPAVGEITHVLVRPGNQGSGIGRALLDAAMATGVNAHLDELVLVTPPQGGARAFYERLGWLSAGTVVSRSGESFVRYRLPLPASDAAGSGPLPTVNE